MIARIVSLALLLMSSGVALAQNADAPVFSGPQVGEALPSFQARGVYGDRAGKDYDIVKEADGKPLLLIFVHERTRPAFGLTNLIMRYGEMRKDDGLTSGFVYLTDDPTATENWMKIVENRFPAGVFRGYSIEGQEGPGSYGLNRNVAVTVLVGKENKVTANFALVQPSIAADGPKILQAIVDVMGGGKVPTLEELGGERYMAAPERGGQDPNLRPLLAAVIKKDASKEEVDKAAAALEEFLKRKPGQKQEVGRIGRTIINAGKLENYGTPAAQQYIRQWAEKYGSDEKPKERR